MERIQALAVELEAALASPDPAAYQALLAAELPPRRAAALGRRIATEGLRAEDVRGDASLTQAEARRASAADYKALQQATAEGVYLVLPEEYPEPLAQLSDPPPALFAMGDIECAHAPTVAIVGTRGASAYGKAVALKYAEAFAKAGITVVSGGAVGIDAAAHRGALSVGGSTIAVLAGGLEKPYPAVNGELFRQIRGNGCMLSQFAIGTRCETYNFIIRNSLIAALSLGVVVIEAPMKSGALATANAANEFGRPVFVVPATIDNLKYAGSHALIRDGATLTDHPNQVLDAIGVQSALSFTPPSPTNEVAVRILQALTVDPRSPELLVEKTGLGSAELLSELTVLELEGAVIRTQGGYAIRP